MAHPKRRLGGDLHERVGGIGATPQFRYRGTPEQGLRFRPVSTAPDALRLDLDGAWGEAFPGVPTLDLRDWGPRLRFCAPARLIEDFWDEIAPRLRPHRGAPLLYGSGDFHHLAGLWVRRGFEAGKEAAPLTLLSFDNHPDWAWTPPQWACGGWINRALDLPGVAEAAVWGCGNMELAWPARLLGNRRAVRAGRLHLFPWRERFAALPSGAWPWLERATWRERFASFLAARKGKRFYVTIDLDGLRAEETLTDWENGLFTLDDLAWALEQVREAGRLAGGDLCGAASGPGTYARPVQRLLARIDHPALPPRSEEERRSGAQLNARAAARLLPLLRSTE